MPNTSGFESSLWTVVIMTSNPKSWPLRGLGEIILIDEQRQAMTSHQYQRPCQIMRLKSLSLNISYLPHNTLKTLSETKGNLSHSMRKNFPPMGKYHTNVWVALRTNPVRLADWWFSFDAVSRQMNSPQGDYAISVPQVSETNGWWKRNHFLGEW